MYMVTLIYVHVCKYFQESESCLPSIPSRREGTASNCKYNCCYKYTQCNLFYTEMHENFSANKTHKLALVKTECET